MFAQGLPSSWPSTTWIRHHVESTIEFCGKRARGRDLAQTCGDGVSIRSSSILQVESLCGLICALICFSWCACGLVCQSLSKWLGMSLLHEVNLWFWAHKCICIKLFVCMRSPVYVRMIIFVGELSASCMWSWEASSWCVTKSPPSLRTAYQWHLQGRVEKAPCAETYCFLRYFSCCSCVGAD